MWGYFFVVLINFMLGFNSLLENSNLFSPNEYEKYDKVILKYFHSLWKAKLKFKKSIVFSVKNIENLKILKNHIFSIKHYLFLFFAVSVVVNVK